MIDYSVSARQNPMDRDADPKFYGNAQINKVMNLAEFSKHIASHGCVYKRADIQAVLTMSVDCLHEMLLNGYKVQLGDLGNFYPSIASEGTCTSKEYNPAIHVKAVNVNWERGALFQDLKEEAEFNLVTTRAIQKTVLKAVKNGDTVIDLAEDPMEPFVEPEEGTE